MAYQSEIDKLKRRYDEKPEQWFAALADAHRKVGDLDRAIRIVQAGILQRPNYVSGHIVLGRCLVDQGADDEAEKVFEEVLELDAENIIALKVLGDVAERRGNWESARRWLGRLLEVDPMNEEARMVLDRVSQPQSTSEAQSASAEPLLATESAARTAGVASKLGTDDEKLDSAPIVEADEVPEPLTEADTEPFPEIEVPSFPWSQAPAMEDADSAPEERQDPEPAEKASDFVIERTSEAMEVVADAQRHPSNPFAALEEAETKFVSFDSPSDVVEPKILDKDDSGELAAGTLDFVAETTPGGPADSRTEDGDVSEEPLSREVLDSEAESVFAELASDMTPLFDAAPAFRPGDERDDVEEGDDDGEAPFEDPADSDLWSIGSHQTSSGSEEVLDSEGPQEEAAAELSPLDSPESEEPKEQEDWRRQFASESTDRFVRRRPQHEEAEAEADEEPPESARSPSLMTETMAEVYAAQGLFDQARDVYRQLLSNAPGDPSLEAGLAALEKRAAAAAGPARNDDSHREFAAAETGGISVRSMLVTMLSETPGSGPADDDVVFVRPSEPSPLEQAFGDVELIGEPTKPAADEPSLASLFGDDESDVDTDDSSSQSDRERSLTYDGFYGSDPAPTTKEPDEAETGDDEEFKAWLRSLRS